MTQGRPAKEFVRSFEDQLAGRIQGKLVLTRRVPGELPRSRFTRLG